MKKVLLGVFALVGLVPAAGRADEVPMVVPCEVSEYGTDCNVGPVFTNLYFERTIEHTQPGRTDFIIAPLPGNTCFGDPSNCVGHSGTFLYGVIRTGSLTPARTAVRVCFDRSGPEPGEACPGEGKVSFEQPSSPDLDPNLDYEVHYGFCINYRDQPPICRGETG